MTERFHLNRTFQNGSKDTAISYIANSDIERCMDFLFSTDFFMTNSSEEIYN